MNYLKVDKILAELQANVIKLDHNQFKTIDRLMEVQLDVTVETNGHEHISHILDELNKRGYAIKEL